MTWLPPREGLNNDHEKFEMPVRADEGMTALYADAVGCNTA